MKIDELLEGVINMMELAKKAKTLLDRGMSEQQVQAQLVKMVFQQDWLLRLYRWHKCKKLWLINLH
jgi:hypothetical protein